MLYGRHLTDNLRRCGHDFWCVVEYQQASITAADDVGEGALEGVVAGAGSGAGGCC